MNGTNWTALVVVFGLICAFAGRAKIEFILWVFEPLSFTWATGA